MAQARMEFHGTIHDVLGIEVLEMTPDRVVLEMDVTARVHQPMGLLHGGASAVMAESAASMGTYMNCDPESEYAVGLELNINHLKAISRGRITATATPIRKGRTIHVWGVDIVDQDASPVAVARCTLIVRPLQAARG